MATEGDAQADVGEAERSQRFFMEQVGQIVRGMGAHGHGAKGGHTYRHRWLIGRVGRVAQGEDVRVRDRPHRRVDEHLAAIVNPEPGLAGEGWRAEAATPQTDIER